MRANPFWPLLSALGALLAAPALAQPPQWQVVPPKAPSNNPAPLQWQVAPEGPGNKEAAATIQWQPVDDSPEDREALVQWHPAPAQDPANPTPAPAEAVPLPAPPTLLAFNRSVAFGTGPVGPDIGWRVPNGFRWTPHHWLDATVGGFSRRLEGENFWAWNNGDAVADIFVNAINSGPWSFTLSQHSRSVSVINDPTVSGGSTAFGQGQSTGFRLGYSLSPSAGIALGGEQILQWDSETDTGRTFYLALSKGWWLGQGAEPFPLLIGNAALATGRLASDPNVRFGCVDTGANYPPDSFYAIDNQLCWSPVGSLALVFRPDLSLFAEYNSTRLTMGTSIAPIQDLPFRATWAVNVLNQIPRGGGFDPDNITWSFRLSLGF